MSLWFRAAIIGFGCFLIAVVGYKIAINLPSAAPSGSQKTVSGQLAALTINEKRLPYFVFRTKKIPIDRLDTKNTRDYLLDKNNIRILGTFPVPGRFNGSENSGITTDAENLILPSDGTFYIRSSIFNAKVLALGEDKRGTSEEIIKIARFVSDNTVHARAHRPLIDPQNNGQFRPQNVLDILFSSPQPLKLHCGEVSSVLAFILEREGYRVQNVGLVHRNGRNGHRLIQVYLPEYQEFALVDADMGALLFDTEDKPVSAQKLVTEFADAPEKLKPLIISQKHFIPAGKHGYTQFSDFIWTPQLATNKLTADPETISRFYADYSLKYETSEYESPSP